jgi:hypothetical protein
MENFKFANEKGEISNIAANSVFMINNLKLLDFHFLNTKEFGSLNINSFTKSNSNLMVTILYFLLNKFNPEIKEKFSFCYPVATLKELKDFKEIAYNEICNIFKDDENLPVKSVLDSASGERLVRLLRNLSDKVIVNEILKFKKFKNNEKEKELISFNNKNSSNSNLSNLLTGFYKIKEFSEWKKKTLLVNITLQRNKLIENIKNVDSVQTQWKTFSSNLENEQQLLEQEKVSIQKKYKNFKDRETDSSIFGEIASLDRAPKLENHKLFREMIDKLQSSLSEKSEFVNNLDFINETNQLYE